MFFTLPILLMGIASLLLFFWQISIKMSGKEQKRKAVDAILFLGSFSFIYGLLGQILGLYQAAGAIQQAGEIAPALIWGGVRVSLIAPLMGFMVLLISSVFWFVAKPSQ